MERQLSFGFSAWTLAKKSRNGSSPVQVLKEEESKLHSFAKWQLVALYRSSKKRKGVWEWYRIDRRLNEKNLAPQWRCSCPAFQWDRIAKYCKHIDRLLEHRFCAEEVRLTEIGEDFFQKIREKYESKVIE